MLFYLILAVNPSDTSRSNLVKCFITRELMRWPSIQGIYGSTLRATTVFGQDSEGGEKRWEDLHTRVVEHVCKYFLSRVQSLTLGFRTFA